MTSIRTMEFQDYDRVYDLWINTPGMGLNTVDDSREGIQRYLRRNPQTCFVAEEDGKIIGAVMAGHHGSRRLIYHTPLRSEYQGRGIGKNLVERAMDALEQEGIHKTALVVFKRNVSGNGFWEKIGFESRDDLVYRNRAIHEMERVDT